MRKCTRVFDRTFLSSSSAKKTFYCSENRSKSHLDFFTFSSFSRFHSGSTYFLQLKKKHKTLSKDLAHFPLFINSRFVKKLFLFYKIIVLRIFTHFYRRLTSLFKKCNGFIHQMSNYYDSDCFDLIAYYLTIKLWLLYF